MFFFANHNLLKNNNKKQVCPQIVHTRIRHFR